MDVRGSRGGLVDGAAALASLFVPDGDLFLVQGRRTSGAQRARGGTVPFRRARLAVLVDGETAAGAEAFAAALQDRRGAAVIGGPTAGRAVITIGVPIGSTGVLLVPASRLVRTSGAAIEGRGVSAAAPPPPPAAAPERAEPCDPADVLPPLVPDEALRRALAAVLGSAA